MICSQCGCKNPDTSRYCSSCAFALENVDTVKEEGYAPGQPTFITPNNIPASAIPGQGFNQSAPSAQPSQPGNLPGYSVPSHEKPSRRAKIALALGIGSFFPGYLLSFIGLGIAITSIVVGKLESKAIQLGQSSRAGLVHARVAMFLGIGSIIFYPIFLFAYCASVLTGPSKPPQSAAVEKEKEKIAKNIDSSAVITTGMLDHTSVTITDVEEVEGGVIIRGTLLNQGTDGVLAIAAHGSFLTVPDGTTLYDDFGNKFVADKIEVANQSDRAIVNAKLLSGVPTKFALYNLGMPTIRGKLQANSIKLLELRAEDNDGKFIAELRNLKIRKK